MLELTCFTRKINNSFSLFVDNLFVRSGKGSDLKSLSFAAYGRKRKTGFLCCTKAGQKANDPEAGIPRAW